MTERNRRLLFGLGITATLAMLYFLGRWLAEASGPAQAAQFLNLLVASAIAAPPCLALGIDVVRHGARRSCQSRHLHLTPAIAWAAIAAVALMVWSQPCKAIRNIRGVCSPRVPPWNRSRNRMIS